jgi:hypothetical protein
MNEFFFHRPDLARQLAGDLLGKGLFGPGSGMFLAGPRRTGKSEFVKRDLIPEMKAQDVTTIYVDLWASKARDPGDVISDAVKSALAETVVSPIKLAVRDIKASKFSLPGFSFDIASIGMPERWSLSEGLATLSRRTGRQICFVIDEAQQTTVSEAGKDAMFGLKAAREALNQTGKGLRGGHSKANLMLVFTGSNRGKLTSLVLGREEAFYGAQVSAFPLLGNDYARAYAAHVNTRLASDARFDVEEVVQAFSLVWMKPEMLEAAAAKAVLGQNGGLLVAAGEIRFDVWRRLSSQWEAMTPLERVVVKLIAAEIVVEPFSSESAQKFGSYTGRVPSRSQIVTALKSLTDSSVLWRSAKGVYLPEDPELADWLDDVQPDVGTDIWQDSSHSGTVTDAIDPCSRLVTEILQTGVRQEDLAEMALVTPKTLRSWRDGTEPKSQKHAKRIRVLHRAIVGSGMQWQKLVEVVPDAADRLRRQVVDLEAFLVASSPDGSTTGR